MAFKIHSTDDGRACPWEYLPCAAIQPKIGMALTQSSGNLTTAYTTTKPTYISMIEAAGALTAGTIIPVIKVQPDIVFETYNCEAFTSRNKGDKVVLAASTDAAADKGMSVGATTTSGVATIVDFDATAIGSRVLVRFE